MAERPNRVGQQLGNYCLIDVLGEGGFAEVYLAEHIYLKTQVAVKVLQEKMEAQYVEGFLKEAQTIAALKHPHILRVLDFGMETSRPFLVMEYAPGGTLRQKHPRGSKVLLSIVISYVKQMAMALQYAHDQKIMHRDVKPENMLVESNGKIVLGDFGIATHTHKTQSLSTQQVAGTVPYMAPEQFQGKSRAASDQYSLGIVVYEWLSGTRPFEGATAIEIAMHHLNDLPPLLREKVPTISPDLEQVVMTVLAKDPKQRFASVQEFAIALEQTSQAGQSQRSISSVGAALASQHVSPRALATPPNRSYSEPIMSSATRSSILEQTSQPEQSPPSMSLPVVTPPSPPLPPTVLAAPLNPIRELTTLALSPSYSSHAPEVSGTQQPMLQPTSHLSRRTVIVGLVGLTLVGSGTTWFVVSHSTALGTTLYTYRGHSDQVSSVAWSPDGKRIASASSDKFSFSVSSDKTVQVWDATDGSNVFTYRGHSAQVWSVAWSLNGKRVASASSDHTVQVWNATDGSNVYTYRGHSDLVNSVVWSPDGKRIASASDDKTVQVWDATDGSNVLTYKDHSDQVSSVAWSPDGKRIASASDDKTVQVWDATDGSNVFTYRGHSAQVWSVAWSPNGKRVASASSDYTVQVWNATNGSNVFTYKGHSDQVDSVAWSPDSKRIASASLDNTVQVWDAADGSNIFTYKGHSDTVSSVAWSPDGKRIASGSGDTTVQVWVAS